MESNAHVSTVERRGQEGEVRDRSLPQIVDPLVVHLRASFDVDALRITYAGYATHQVEISGKTKIIGWSRCSYSIPV
jgi:hypothetical protein